MASRFQSVDVHFEMILRPIERHCNERNKEMMYIIEKNEINIT